MSDGEERRYPPSAARRRRARQEGRVVTSRDLTASVALLATLLFLRYAGPGAFAGLSTAMRAGLEGTRCVPLTAEDAPALVARSVAPLLAAFAPLIALSWGAAAAVGVVQTGLFFRPEGVLPSWDRLSPLGGISRLFSLRSAGRTIFAVLKLATTGWLVTESVMLLLRSGAGRSVAFSEGGLAASAGAAVDRLLGLAIAGAVALVILAAFDWFFERWLLERDLRMTRREMLEEAKEQGASPQVERRSRALRRRVGIARAPEESGAGGGS